MSPPGKLDLPPFPNGVMDVEPTTITEVTHITRGHAYQFVVDGEGRPIELGSGRFAKVFLGEELWLESKTGFRRHVAIKILQKGVSREDALRFGMEKELLERVQGHPNIVNIYTSGESDWPEFIPQAIRDKVENDFTILELCDLSLEERLKGVRGKGDREDLLSYPPLDRLFRVLEYMLPVASGVEFAHLERNICHRDIKPGNILLRRPNPRLRGDQLEVRLADFNAGKVRDEAIDLSITRVQNVPGTVFFQAPEQETNSFELLVNLQRGVREVDYFEDLYIDVTKNDTFQVFNRPERYIVLGCDRIKRKVILDRPFQEGSESNVRAQITKCVDRPADIYSLGATLYYLVSGASGNPKGLYDAFRKFIEYDGDDEQNTVESYIEHEYATIQNMRAPKSDQPDQPPQLAPIDRFFTYKHFLDGNGELIDKEVIKIIARAMIRNKPDSYCQAWDTQTEGISELVTDLRSLYERHGFMPTVRPGNVPSKSRRKQWGKPGLLKRFLQALSSMFSSKPKASGPTGGSQPPPRLPPGGTSAE